MKKIMFVGAGEYQEPGILVAKKMGLHVIAIDRNPKAMGFKYADASFVVDVKDAQKALKVARAHDIDGVLTVSSDIAVPTVSIVAEELGLPGISTRSAGIATNKGLMKRIFLENGIPSPDFITTSDIEEAREAMERLGLPVVIKPTDNAGSRGVRVIGHECDLKECFGNAMENSREKKVIIEEFVEGRECTIEGMAFDNITEILAMSEKKKPDSGHRVATELVYPPGFSREKIEEIRDMTKKALKAAGIGFGPSHSEAIMTENGPELIEISARGGGFRIFSQILPLVSGVDAMREHIKMCTGETPDIKPKREHSAVLRFFAPAPGLLREIKGIQKAKTVKNVRFGFFIKPGEMVPILKSDGDRTGYILSWSPRRGDALKKASMVEAAIDFVVER